MIRQRKATGVLGSMLKNITEESIARTRNRMLIASKIATAIKSKGYTQKEFAAIMGKTESEISEWLSGDRNFTIDTLTDIGRALNITLLNVSQMSICLIPHETTLKIRKSKTVSINEQINYNIIPTCNFDTDNSDYSIAI